MSYCHGPVGHTGVSDGGGGSRSYCHGPVGHTGVSDST